MRRSLPLFGFALLLLAACSTSKPIAKAAPIDPATDPTVIGAVDESVREGTIEAEAAARTGRRIGQVAGVLAALFGGPESESVDDAIQRYRDTRDAAETTGAVIGATKGAVAGAKRGYELDVQFAELARIEGVSATRPQPDVLEVRFAPSIEPATLAKFAAVFSGREPRALDIEAAGEAAFDIRESLINLGLPNSSLHARRNDDLDEVFVRIRYRD